MRIDELTTPALVVGADMFETSRAPAVLSVSDEHVTFTHDEPVSVGDHVMVWPAHLDPTVAFHERMHLVGRGDVLETWRVDLRGW